jgi:hypothetical protein
MQGGARWAVSATLVVGLASVCGAAVPLAGAAIKVEKREKTVAKFRTVDCKLKDGRPIAFQAKGRANGWAFRSEIYGRKLNSKIYDVEYGDNSKADVAVFPPKGPHFTNQNKPRTGDGAELTDAGSVGFAKGRKVFGVALPLIYDSERREPPPNDVTVSGLANCNY